MLNTEPSPAPQAPPLHAITRATKARPTTAVKGNVQTAPKPTQTARIAPASPAQPLASFAAGVYATPPFEAEVATSALVESVMDRADASRAMDAMKARVSELEAEVMDYAGELGELLDELKRANLPPDLSCKARDILVLLDIDKGETVAAIAQALQTVAYDLKSRRGNKYKGNVKVKLACTEDQADYDAMVICAEVAAEVPAQATGGRLHLATDGTVITQRECAQAFQLKMVEPTPDPMEEAFGIAGKVLEETLRAKGVSEITVGKGPDATKIRFAANGTKRAA